MFFFSVLVPCVLHIRVAVGFVGTSRWFRLECDGLRYTSFKDMVSSVVGQGGVGWLCLEVPSNSRASVITLATFGNPSGSFWSWTPSNLELNTSK